MISISPTFMPRNSPNDEFWLINKTQTINKINFIRVIKLLTEINKIY